MKKSFDAYISKEPLYESHVDGDKFVIVVELIGNLSEDDIIIECDGINVIVQERLFRSPFNLMEKCKASIKNNILTIVFTKLV